MQSVLRITHVPKPCWKPGDRLGMLVMDEYVDMWYIHKTEHDYASYMQENWREDLKAMVEKDYNHPSVIMYSTGNEVAETGQKKGISLTGQMTEYLHSLDFSRPVTCGINIFFNFLSSLGFGVYSDKKARKEAEWAESQVSGAAPKKKPVGSEFYNTLAGTFGDKCMKIGAMLHGCDVKTRDAYARMDIAGYNYGIYRYKGDLRRYPKRLILGSETFCRDAYLFWELAKKHPRIVGDFVWAGMDYMGEAGIGAWENEKYAPLDADESGWLTAGSGRINILGIPNAEAAYTKVALEQTDEIFLAVRPVHLKGKHSPSAWKLTDAMQSWSFRGSAGEKAVVEVYARAASAALFLNGRCVGKKTLKNTCRAIFTTTYEDGELCAVAYDDKGCELKRTSLKTAGAETKLTLLPEQNTVRPGGLSYIKICYTDNNGVWKPTEDGRIHVTVENGTLLGLGHACSYNTDGYKKDTTGTYHGYALAIVQAEGTSTVRVMVSDTAGHSESAVIGCSQESYFCQK